MCVIAVAFRQHDFRLVVAANRDESHARPTIALAPWKDQPGIIAGRDLLSGGTWLGISRDGRFAAVTNVRAKEAIGSTSRGLLVSRYLSGTPGWDSRGAETDELFRPYNLIVADQKRAAVISNYPVSARTELKAGVHAFSNGSLKEPWPRSCTASALLETWLASGPRDPSWLLDRLGPDGAEESSKRKAQAAPPDAMSDMFLTGEEYGTRSSTALVIGADGRGRILERRYAALGRPAGESEFEFHWPDLAH